MGSKWPSPSPRSKKSQVLYLPPERTGSGYIDFKAGLAQSVAEEERRRIAQFIHLDLQRVMPIYEIFKVENRQGFFMKVEQIFRMNELIFMTHKDQISGVEYRMQIDDFSDYTYGQMQSDKGKKCVSCIKKLVSRNKRRYIDRHFNLDLACVFSLTCRYISKRIIAMGFPAFEKFEPVYRNSLTHVISFFKDKHKNKVKIYNLCSEQERIYNPQIFKGLPVACFPMPDHNPCSLEIMLKFCVDAFLFMTYDCQNTLAIHCKAGKGRTGTMICALQIFLNMNIQPSMALRLYGIRRSKDYKGVTIPSQRRYLDYFAHLIYYKPATNWVNYERSEDLIARMEEQFDPIYEMKPLGVFIGPFGTREAAIDLKININVLQRGGVKKLEDIKNKLKKEDAKRAPPPLEEDQEPEEEEADLSELLSQFITFRFKINGVNTVVKDKVSGQFYLLQKFQDNDFKLASRKKGQQGTEEYFLKGDFQYSIKTNKLKKFGFWLNTDFSVREAGETPYFESEEYKNKQREMFNRKAHFIEKFKLEKDAEVLNELYMPNMQGVRFCLNTENINLSGYLKPLRCKTLVLKKRYESYKQRKVSFQIADQELQEDNKEIDLELMDMKIDQDFDIYNPHKENLLQINMNKYDIDKVNKNKNVPRFYCTLLFKYRRIDS